MRQYIGARYVPLFMGEWNPTLTYAPLSIVMYGNASYTSKIPVPAGTLPTNTKYWYISGNYNGQIESLDKKIDAVNQNLQGQITSNDTDINDLENKVAELGTQSYSDFVYHTLFMFDDNNFQNSYPHQLYVPNGAIYSGRWQNGWEGWGGDKSNIKNIVILGGGNESQGTTHTQLETMCSAFGTRNIIYIWTYDEWRTQSRAGLYTTMRRIELLPQPLNFKFETLMGFIHYNIYYNNNGKPQQNYYQLMSKAIDAYLKGNQFLTAQFISSNYGECIIDGHTAYFASNIINVSLPNWVDGYYVDIPTDSFLNPGNFAGFIIGYSENNVIQISSLDYSRMRVQQLTGTSMSGSHIIAFPDFSYSMHML